MATHSIITGSPTRAPTDPLTGASDFVVEAIAELKRRERAVCRASNKLEDASEKGAERLGRRRPVELIVWRDYHIGGSEIDRMRERLLAEPDADAATIEAEYADAKKRYRATARAARQWDEKAGIGALARQVDEAWELLREARACLARAEPTTPQGAAALVSYLYREIEGHVDEWQRRALKTLSATLKGWEARS
ncbi:hypothetical protein IYW40_09225 [Methylocystis sp. H4A]|uniref:hypothetical protein n=1 Tax=Methylocystis sp. H4A TaxID=2785788 RepID=UPI0018C30F94|nr:hypothetical protein [Methylocystis sp. H4A]MBG0801665.1 hypothetical protein [Methylocystis sp. H4A]